MKIIIASDLHGSFYYVNKLIKRFHESNADKLVLLGDILYHGPRNDLPRDYNPKKVIESLNNLKDNGLKFGAKHLHFLMICVIIIMD